MGLKRDKRDIVFSGLVRERAEWVCENCGKYYPPGLARKGLHCSHYVGRSHRSTRWHPENAFSHCYGCHAYFEGNPGAFFRWVVERIGALREQALIERGNMTVKRTKADLEDLHKHLKAEWQRVQALRADGVTGRIEFVGWD